MAVQATMVFFIPAYYIIKMSLTYTVINGNIFLSQNTLVTLVIRGERKGDFIMALYDDDRDITFEIIEEIGIISTMDTGWAKEINLVRWNGGVAKYDIREWDPSHTRMSRGITLKEEEMRRILDLMRKRRSNVRSRRRTEDAEPAVTVEAVSEALDSDEAAAGAPA